MTCNIRPWRLKDADDLASALNNKKILDNLRDGLPFPYTKKDAISYIDAMLNADKDKTFPFAITIDDKVIGSIGVFRMENIHSRSGEIGYYIAEPYWGIGLGTSAVQQICRFIFSTTDIIRIFAEPFSRNTASCRILEKSGFVKEGIMRKNAFKNGVFEDMTLYALIKNNNTIA
ncbi:hypothetical protein SDC9_123879 [bioreactor metagenome]|uniref:N-acetyltransferase domain-containing protein n=1 Tax=bioreactor metagenome TaxID=1076179 RepID=A0A645CIV8_9ZZZZ